jgi:transcriptional regulator with XRE-family HTH domain
VSADIRRVPTWSASARVVEQERILRGWTRRQLAQAANVDPKTLGDFVGGRRRPQLGTVRALCGALGLRLTDVIVFPEVADQAAGS